jgi:hypothetical protein
VHFDGSGSYDPEGGELEYVWNFGNIQSSPIGVGDIIPSPDYTYEDAGTFCAKLTVTDDMGASSSAVVLIFAGSEPTTGEMHIHSIAMSLESKGPNVNANAKVTILDASDSPVSGATVSGQWSGQTTDSDTGVTDGNGEVTLKSDRVKNPTGPFTFTVTGVAKDGWTYDPDANVVDSGTINPPVGAPALATAYPTGLENAYPSPGNPETWIPFTLEKAEHVVIKIYNVTGQLVRTLDLGDRAAGAYLSKDKAAHWDGRNVTGEKVSSGIYFYLMEAGSFRAARKLLIIR